MSELRQLLYQYPRGVTVNEIAAHLDVTARSARRYLRELSLHLEASVDKSSGEKRWRIPALDMPRRVALRRNQAYALLAAQPLLRLLQGSALHEEIKLANEMLVGVARRRGRGPNTCGDADDIEQRFRYATFAPEVSPKVPEHVDMVFHALAERHPLRCYLPCANTARLQPYTLHPYALLLYKDALHCIGALHTPGSIYDSEDGLDQEEDIRALSLSHLEGLRVLHNERFELPADFRVEDYHQGQFGLWRQTATRHNVVIDFAPNFSAVVKERSLHESQRVEPLDGGAVRLHLQLSSLDEVATWVLGFGSGARVRQPIMLRDRVRAEIQRALDNYPESPA